MAKTLGLRARRAPLILVLAAVLAATAWWLLAPREPPPCPARALVVDTLSEDFPNETLVKHVVEVLRSAGYQVDLVVGREAGPEVFERLTDYAVVILRVHGGKAAYIGLDGRVHYINGIFTGLPWKPEYEWMKREWIGTRARPYHAPHKAYLALLPKFFEKRMKGVFCRDSVVVVASCFGLYTTRVAEAMASRGLKTYVAWRGPVTVKWIDEALWRLVDYVFLHNMTWVEAVEKVNQELGPDPVTNETLQVVVFRGACGG